MLRWSVKRKIKKALEIAQADVLTKKNAKVDLMGNAVIPPNTRRIAHGAFEGNARLRRVALPASVKTLSERAFANCVNLEQVQLNEGLTEIEGNVFNGCGKLTSVVFPDSLQDVRAYTFHGAGFTAPVYDRSQTVLYHHPADPAEATVIVPDHVKRLGAGAFFDDPILEEVILPEGLETIDTQGFCQTNLRRITIPATVRKIESEAFWNCPELETVDIRCPVSALSSNTFYKCPKVQFKLQGAEPDFETDLQLRGISLFAVPRRLQIPEGDFWTSKPFTGYAGRCAEGDTEGMLRFADYFESLGQQEFFQYAANFWRYRAFLYADPKAALWKQAWMQAHPRQRIPMVLPATLRWTISGQHLRALGFRFFEPDREYSLEGADENGIVLVSSWCDSDPADEDGFGREEYYDWWYLDEHLNPIPGIWRIGCCSNRDRQLLLKERFEAQYAKAVKALRNP